MSEYPPECPHVVKRASMEHRWDQLTFLHWSYPPTVVQGLLPKGLEVETFDGAAWVGLVPFFLEIRPPRGPKIPWLLRFAETNVRTYVRDSNGNTGVWFFSLDASRLAAVLAARSTYRVPYFWSKLSLRRQGDRMEYTTVRRWPGPRGAASSTQITIGSQYQPDELTIFDHYLTARYTLFGSWGKQMLYARAQHEPWTLHRAEAHAVDDELVPAVGLPRPEGPPVVHWSPGVDVRIGLPRRMA